MLRLIIISFLFALFAAIIDVDGKLPSRISGGQDVPPGEFGFVVSLGDAIHSSTHFCGGAIISPRHILTAGHCISGRTTKIVVRSGALNLRTGNPRVSNVEQLVLHPNYTLQTTYRPFTNDIGILVLAEDLVLDGRLTSEISLPTQLPDMRKLSYVAGWGALSVKARIYNSVLKKTSIRLLDDEGCKLRQAVPQHRKLCGYETTATVCQGDSGGPLVSGDRIIGIVSTSWCKNGEAHSYTSVYEYLDWINLVIIETSRNSSN